MSGVAIILLAYNCKLRQSLAIPLIEGWIDEAERRVWFLFEAGRK